MAQHKEHLGVPFLAQGHQTLGAFQLLEVYSTLIHFGMKTFGLGIQLSATCENQTTKSKKNRADK